MIKKIIKKIYIFIFINSFFIKIKNQNRKNFNYNFLNINFDNYENSKNIFLSKKYYKGKFLNEKDYNYHCFDWLQYAKKIGGSKSINNSKKLIFIWNKNNYSKNTFVWEVKITAKRLANLIYNYDFYAISAANLDKNLLDKIILEHFLIINLEINQKKVTELKIEEYKSLLLGFLIYNKDTDKILKILLKLLTIQIDKNGFHKSYNPMQQAEFLNNLHEIKNMLLFFKISVPNELSYHIINMTALLTSLLHKDNSLALFNGSNDLYNKEVHQIINLENDVKSKDLKKINKGIAIYNDKNKKIFMDIVLPINQLINNNLHASTHAIEISSQGEKIITSCGSIEKRIGKKPEYLRYSAAHSTIILNNTNISELVENKSYKRAPKKIIFLSEEDKNYIIWKSTHDGYVDNFKKIVKRSIFISKDENKIIGQDSIISTKMHSKKISYSIRFHLMPNSNCLITNNYKSVLIKTKLNQTWIFKSNSKISIEDSIYINNGKKVEQNKQIVINGTADDKKKIENWSLIKS